MKRYVLLEDKTIIDTKDRPLFHIEENTLWHNSMFQGAILNQSDNLIDLAEVGDCYEIKGGQLYSVDDNFELCQIPFYIEVFITAIWKRNGDVMRRYER